MSFTYPRTVHFQETDAAGVVYFANILAICHEAYEASLAAAGIDLRAFFRQGELVVPLVHASGDFLRPLFCGDRLLVNLTPQQLTPEKFAIHYQVTAASESALLLAKALTQHVCIESSTRTKTALPTQLLQWLRQYGE